jgi:hypothetical protein
VFPSVLVTTEPSPSTVISLGSETSYLTRPLLSKPVTICILQCDTNACSRCHR